MKNLSLTKRRCSILNSTMGACLVAAISIVQAPSARAANTLSVLSSTNTSPWSTAAWAPAGAPSGAGNVATYTGTTAGTTTLDVDTTIGVIKNFGTGGPGSWTINSDGTHFFTLDGTGLTAGNNPFGIAGEAAIALTTNAVYIVNPNIVISNTNLGVGTIGNSPITLAGNITATTNQTINIRGGGSGGINLTGNIGQSGSNIAISNANSGTSALVISAALGGSVNSVIQNSAGASMTLSGANTYVGTTTLTQGSLIGTTSTFSNTPLSPFGTSSLALNGGALTLRAPGLNNNSTVETVTFGNNTSIGGNTTINVAQSTISAATNSKTIALGTLSIGANTLTVTGANSYKLQFAGTTTATGAAIFNPVTAPLTLGALTIGDSVTTGTTTAVTLDGTNTGNIVSGVISNNGADATKVLALTKSNLSTWTLNGSAVNTYTGATTVNGGTLVLDFANLATPTNLINSASTLTLGGGTLSLIGKASTTTSQTLGNLNISGNSGQNLIKFTSALLATTTNLTLGNTWTRSGGSTLNIDLTVGTGSLGAKSVFSNAALTNGIIGGYATLTGTSFATITGGAVAGASTSSLTSTTNDGTVNYSTSSSVTHNAGDWSANSMVLNGGGLNIGGGTLTLTSGGLLNRGTTGGQTDLISNGQLGTTNSEVIIHSYATSTRLLEVSATISGGTGSLTKGGTSTLVLTGENVYTGNTIVGGGTLQIGNGGTGGGIASSANVIIRPGTTLAYNATDASTVKNVTGGGIVNANSGTLTLVQSGSGLTIRTIGGLSGGTIEFAGDGTGITSLGDAIAGSVSYLNVAGQNYKFTSGIVNLLDNARGSTSNIEIAGGTVNVLNNPLSMAGVANNSLSPQTFKISSGTLNANASNGVSGFNGSGGATQAGIANSTFIGTQTGGTISVTGVAGRFHMGNTSSGDATTYNMSGGVISQPGATLGMALGADIGGTSTTTFNFSGGKIIEGTSITGGQGAGAKQAFVWTGGTLATFAYDATNLTSTLGTAVNLGVTNTLTNGGGILAPGDIGTVGKTLITGRYSVPSANAALAIDIGGTTAASLFQEASGSGKFDNIQTNGAQGTASLGGKLNVALVDSFTPTNVNTFKIVNTIASGVSGTFNNAAVGSTVAGGGVRVALGDGLSSFRVVYNTADVTLDKYLADNQWAGLSGSNWSTGNDWAAFTPSVAGHIAKFADTPAAGAVAVNLDANETVAGLQFNSTTRNYTVSTGAASALTLDNNGAASAITVAGTHNINVPVALNNNVTVTATGSGDSLSIGGAISGTSKSLTKAGSGTLALSGANTYTGATAVTAGTLLVSAGDINSSAVTVAGGARLAYNSSTARTNTITLSGSGATRATLSGTGTINMALTLDNLGDTLSPGNSPGVQNFATGQSWNAFTYVWETNNFTGTTAGTDFDQITITGGLDLTGSTGAYLLDITSLQANNTPGNVPNFSEVNRSWTILTTTTGITGFDAANWTMGTGGFTSSPTAAGNWTLTQLNNDLVLSYAIPEPATWGLLAFSLTTVMVLRRRRNP